MANSIKVRAKVGGDGVTQVKMLISHPMSLDQVDAATGQVKTPGHYIQELTCTHKGATVFATDWGQAVSTNPYLEFSFKGAAAGDSLAVSWRDSKGQSDKGEFKIG
jgi:sulfur-oxidizing protein SoxZ